MKKDEKNKEPDVPEKRSLAIAIEQLAKMLRSQTRPISHNSKGDPRQIAPLPSHPGSLAFFNEVTQVAKMLREQLHASETLKKRKWKSH